MPMYLSAFDDLLQKEMDRKEFLLYLGLILLTITGISGVLKSISTITHPKAEKGFGSGPYGV